jgi:hypothetical protein
MARVCVVGVLLCLGLPAVANAQDPLWRAEVTIGWAGFVDDSTQDYLVFGGSVRRSITPRLSIGPEIVVMRNPDLARDLNYMVTGNFVYDVLPSSATRRVTPFIVGGVGIFRGRDQVRNGPFWFSEGAFTAGGGARIEVSDAMSALGEYRIGWELHQRLTGSVAVHW